MWCLQLRSPKPTVGSGVGRLKSFLAAQPLQGWHEHHRARRIGELLSTRERTERPRTGTLRQSQTDPRWSRGITNALDRDPSIRLRRALQGPAGAAMESTRLSHS